MWAEGCGRGEGCPPAVIAGWCKGGGGRGAGARGAGAGGGAAPVSGFPPPLPLLLLLVLLLLSHVRLHLPRLYPPSLCGLNRTFRPPSSHSPCPSLSVLPYVLPVWPLCHVGCHGCC